MKIRTTILLFLLVTACNNSDFIPIEFKIEEPSFEKQPYKFSKVIHRKAKHSKQI